MPPSSRPRAVHHRHSSAEHHRHAPHGARPEQHAAGRLHPVPPDGRARGVPGSRAPTTPASPRRTSSRSALKKEGKTRHDLGREKFPGAGVGLAGTVRRRHHQAAPEARLLVRLGARAIHDGRDPVRGRARGLCPAVRGGADLPRQVHRQLVPARPYRDQRRRGELQRAAGKALLYQLPARGRGRPGRVPHRCDHPAGNDAGRYGGRGESRRRAVQPSRRDAALSSP